MERISISNLSYKILCVTRLNANTVYLSYSDINEDIHFCVYRLLIKLLRGKVKSWKFTYTRARGDARHTDSHGHFLVRRAPEIRRASNALPRASRRISLTDIASENTRPDSAICQR